MSLIVKDLLWTQMIQNGSLNDIKGNRLIFNIGGATKVSTREKAAEPQEDRRIALATGVLSVAVI